MFAQHRGQSLCKRACRSSLYGIVLLLCTCVLVGCRGERPAPVDARDLDPFSPDSYCAWQEGDPEAGRQLFEQPVLAGVAGCITCHSMAPDVTLVGPSLHGVVERASTRQVGVRADNYLYLSIVAPNQFVVPGFPADVMPTAYAGELSQEEITNLVSYLMTLNNQHVHE